MPQRHRGHRDRNTEKNGFLCASDLCVLCASVAKTYPVLDVNNASSIPWTFSFSASQNDCDFILSRYAGV
jgi:hypothetical protein